jgi:uncharacterized protein
MKAYRAHETREHLVRSRIVAQRFRVRTLLPVSRTDGSERFPVVYATDGDLLFEGLSSIASFLQHHGETPRFILVGIGYENAGSAELLRQRDFYTHGTQALYRAETERVAKSPLVVPLNDPAQTTDASEFLQFICAELMPFVNGNYPTSPDDTNYFGYSAGGAFGLYTLFTRPGTFKRYILGSPTTSYSGRHFGRELVKAFVQSGRSMDAQLFLSVGELEEFKRGLTQFDLVTGLYLLAKVLGETAIPHLDWTMRVFSGETHATAWTLAFSHGLKTLLGPADQVPF